MAKWVYPVVKTLSEVFRGVVKIRNWAYDAGHLESEGFTVPIVSVGNITVGGTGKTPILCELVRWALEAGLKPAIISRGYRGEFEGVQKVLLGKVGTGRDAAVFGDEPALMASLFPQVPVYVGRDRVEVMKKLLQHESVTIVFADDGFQHRRLKRQLDVVVLDATEAVENYRLMPLGRAREPLSAFQRAGTVILNKVNLISPDQKQKLFEFLEAAHPGVTADLIESEYYVQKIRSLESGDTAVPQKYEKIFALSAVGNPAAFEKLLRLQFDVQKHFRFNDHHAFKAADIVPILNEAGNSGVARILMTEKDAVKVRDLPVSKASLWQTVLTVKMSLKVKKLHEKILQLAH